MPLPGGLGAHYTNTFEGHISALQEIRQSIEDGIASPGSITTDMLLEAKAQVQKYKSDKTAVENLSDIYI
eukprot:12110986-Alexandrium_andersonii.AAC.1